jgi:hypothetical protein
MYSAFITHEKSQAHYRKVIFSVLVQYLEFIGLTPYHVNVVLMFNIGEREIIIRTNWISMTNEKVELWMVKSFALICELGQVLHSTEKEFEQNVDFDSVHAFDFDSIRLSNFIVD